MSRLIPALYQHHDPDREWREFCELLGWRLAYRLTDDDADLYLEDGQFVRVHMPKPVRDRVAALAHAVLAEQRGPLGLVDIIGGFRG